MSESHSVGETPGVGGSLEVRERALLAWGVIERLMEQAILHYFEIGPDRTDMFDQMTDRLSARDKIDAVVTIANRGGDTHAPDEVLRGRLIRLREIVSVLARGHRMSGSDNGVFDIHVVGYGRHRDYQIDAAEFLGELGAVSRELGSVVAYWKDRSTPFQRFVASPAAES